MPASLFRQRDFTLLFVGGTVSAAGSAVTTLALPLVALTVLGASPFEVGLLTAMDQIGWLLIGLVAGVWVDRVRRRPVMIGADLARALVLASVPVAWALDALTIGQLVGVALLLGLLTVVFDVASPAFLPVIVARERLVEGNGHLYAGNLSAYIAGPGLGGLLVQVLGAPVALLADAVSYLLSAASIGAIRATEPQPAGEARPVGEPRPVGEARKRPNLWRDLAVGLRHVRTHAVPRAVITAVPVANFVFGGYSAVVVVFLYRQVGLSAAVIGTLMACSGAGGVLGAVVAGRLAGRLGDARLIWLAPAVTAACGLLIPLTSPGAGLIWFAVGAFGLDVGIVCFNVCVISAIQSVTPAGLMGRVTASIRLFTRTALPLGALAGGALAGIVSPRVTLVVLLTLLAVVPVRLRLSAVGRVRDTAELATTGPHNA